MMLKEEKLHLKKLLADTIPLLCKNGLPLHSTFRVEAMIGITVNSGDVTLICFKETVTSDGELLPQMYGADDDDFIENENCEKFSQPETENHPIRTFKTDQTNETSSQIYAYGNEESCGGINSLDNNVQYLAAGVKSEKDDSADVDTTRYLPSDRHEVDSSSYMYEGEMMDGSGFDAQTALVARSDGPRSQSTGSVRFRIKEEEEDLEADDCMFIKEEQPSSFSSSFDFGQSSNNIPTNSRQRSRRGRTPYPASNSHQSQMAVPQVMPWQRKTKQISLLRNRKPSGVSPSMKLAARNMMPAAMSEGRSRGSSSEYKNMIQGLCDSILKQSTQNGEQYVCHICEAKLSNATTLRNHIRGTHLALKTERCNVCGESFKWAMQLARHKKRQHGDMSFIPIYNAGTGGNSGQDEY